jgi:hypothetical protein
VSRVPYAKDWGDKPTKLQPQRTLEAQVYMEWTREENKGLDEIIPILQMGTDKMIPRHVSINYSVLGYVTSKCEGGAVPTKKGGLIWYTDE